MTEVWEGIDLPSYTLFGNWVLKRMEFCAGDDGVRIRFVTHKGLVKELGILESGPVVNGRAALRRGIRWDDWRRIVSRIDYQKYGR